jgi:hypothetical protein
MPYQNQNTPILSNNKVIVMLSIALLFVVFLLYLYGWYNGSNQVISWQVLSELGNTNAIIDRFQLSGQAYEIPAKAYYVTEQYVASNMVVNEQAANIWLLIFFISLSFISAAVTNFKNYWYYGAMVFLILAMASLSFDALFGKSNYIYSGFILAGFIGISYFFFAYKTEASLFVKFLAFLMFFGVIWLVVKYLSADPKPFLYLAAKTIPSAMILATVFIFAISYEIILAILTISTKGGATNSLLNFSIGTFIYLLNITLTYLHNINYLDWDILYFSPYLLLLVSVGLSIWNLKKKAIVFENITNSFSSVLLFCIGLAIIALSIVSYAFATGNDPLLEAIEDAIIYTHLAMGVTFFGYVFFNFLPLFKQKLDVAKVVFKPLQFPLIYYRGFAVLVIFAILVNNDYFPVMQSISGYYNALADHSAETKQYKLAEAYYKTALGYERQNHKSNYALASLAAIQGDNTTAGSYFRLAIQKKPTPYTFAALSNTLQKEDLFFEAMFALRDGLKKFPKSGELQNNLALLFEKSKLPDSTLKYLELAKINAEKSEIPEANLLSFWIKNGDTAQQQIALNYVSDLNYNALNANKLAINLLAEKKIDTKNFYIFDGDSTLSVANFAYMNNQVVSKRNAEIPFQKIINNESNFNLADDLRLTQFFKEFYKGNKIVALDLLQNQLTTDSTEKSRYKQLLFNTLLKKTQEDINVEPLDYSNQYSALAILDKYPLNETILKKATNVLNKEGNMKDAYEAILSAKKWLPESAEIQKMYILQCFKINMTQYAKDGMINLKSMNQKEYNSFLPVYQAQMSLVEKQTEGFN